ncbi:hypothetical protein C7H84_28990 [Burkholderia sp. Nafp2/4-1b]|uniref:hypothetical protein n=1 Tax=Burkholderia sp. Nafp2/4-1b TaxID=2116686 RepID=UPI000EF9667C|nr:hypothetical protein [Burkholderia sp. Nafp2/4-1b]RKT99799.1 hypothetical protein C7H84_28990 [Burkholderia sp. Nafp2/4-1b]
MERFKPDMGCCRVAREQAELCCGHAQQLACATAALAHRFDTAPDQAGRILADVMSTFPDRIAVFLAEALRVRRFDVFSASAARICASLPTKAERHAFRDQIVGSLCAADLSTFDERMSAEWRRLRGK